MSNKLEAANIPSALSSLLSAAEKWGIGDDGFRVIAVEQATNDELLSMIRSLDSVDQNALWDWLEGPEAETPNPSAEYVAITCLTMAVETAESVLKERGVSM